MTTDLEPLAPPPVQSRKSRVSVDRGVAIVAAAAAVVACIFAWWQFERADVASLERLRGTLGEMEENLAEMKSIIPVDLSSRLSTAEEMAAAARARSEELAGTLQEVETKLQHCANAIELLLQDNQEIVAAFRDVFERFGPGDVTREEIAMLQLALTSVQMRLNQRALTDAASELTDRPPSALRLCIQM